MAGKTIAYLLTCGPIVVTVPAWVKLYRARLQQWPRALTLTTLGIVTANAGLAAGTYLYFESRPRSGFLPPWQDPETLQLGMLFLLAPVGMILGAVAGARGAPKWLVWIVEIASLPLLVVGFFAAAAV
jgi:hypothetical protein